MSERHGGLRIALAGATGTLAREVIDVLESGALPVEAILPFATGDSLGEDIEFRGEVFPVTAEIPPLRGVDLVLVCAPPSAALAVIRKALQAEAPCVDCSGALSDSPDVPLLVSALSSPSAALGVPLIATPAGPALGWALALAPLVRAAGFEGLTATVLRSVARGGRMGIDALSRETLALLGQYEVPEPERFTSPVAFDCAPLAASEGAPDSEARMVADLERLLSQGSASGADREPGWLADRTSLQCIQVPTFVSDVTSMVLRSERRLDPSEARDLLGKAPGVEVLAEPGQNGPSMRDAANSDLAMVGQLAEGRGRERELRFWLAADAVRLSAVNAIALAETRLRLN